MSEALVQAGPLPGAVSEAFYTSHRRVCAHLRDGKLALGGAAHRNAEAFGREFDRLCEVLGVPARNAAQRTAA